MIQSVVNFFEERFGEKSLGKFFLVCALPIHIWAFYMVLNDVSIIEQRDAWFYIGYVSYSLVYALWESFFIFATALGLSLLMPNSWRGKVGLLIFSAWIYVISFWGMIDQINFLGADPVREFLFSFYLAINSSTSCFIFFILVVLGSIILPLTLKKNARLQSIWTSLLDRLAILSGVYIVLDGIAFVIVIIRNIQGMTT